MLILIVKEDSKERRMLCIWLNLFSSEVNIFLAKFVLVLAKLWKGIMYSLLGRAVDNFDVVSRLLIEIKIIAHQATLLWKNLFQIGEKRCCGEEKHAQALVGYTPNKCCTRNSSLDWKMLGLGSKQSVRCECWTYDVRTPVTDRSLLCSVSSKDECKVSMSVGLITLMFSLVTELLTAIH